MELSIWAPWALALLVFGLVFAGPSGVKIADGAGRDPESVGICAGSVASRKALHNRLVTRGAGPLDRPFTADGDEASMNRKEKTNRNGGT